MELTEVMRTTPATRDFTDEPVEDSALERVLESARFAPSGGNRQPWRASSSSRIPRSAGRSGTLTCSDGAEYRAHVAEGRVPFAPDQHGRWEGPAVDLAAARGVERPDAFADHLDTVPVMLLLFVDLTALAVLDNGLGRQSIVGGGSIYPFGHNVLLAARNEGLGGVLTTIISREEAPLKSLLGVPENFALAGLIVLGHPRRSITRLRRQAVADFTRIDSFGGAEFGTRGAAPAV